jgi:hypothetical protein
MESRNIKEQTKKSPETAFTSGMNLFIYKQWLEVDNICRGLIHIRFTSSQRFFNELRRV